MSTETDTSWIVAGTEVVIFQIGRTERYDNVYIGEIMRVAQKSFAVQVDGRTERYSMDRQDRRGASAWDGTYHCVPSDGEKGRDVLRNLAYQRSVHRGRSAVENWLRERNQENRLAAVAALQAIDESHA